MKLFNNIKPSKDGLILNNTMILTLKINNLMILTFVFSVATKIKSSEKKLIFSYCFYNSFIFYIHSLLKLKISDISHGDS